MVGVILAAGDGTRLKNSINENCCKALRKINGRYLIEFSLNNLINLGVSEAYVVVGKQGALIKNVIGNKYNSIKISYVHQEHQKGLINAFVQTINIIKNTEDVILQLTDEIFFNLNAKHINTVFSKTAFDFYCGITYEENPQKIKNNFSVEIEENSIIKNCIEKPAVVINNIKGTGLCIFRNNSVQLLKKMYDETTNTPEDLCDYMNNLIAQGQKGITFIVAEKEFNINTASDLKEAQNFFADKNL